MKSLAVCLLSLLVSVSGASAEAPTVLGQVRLVDGSPVAGASVLLFDVSDLRRGALGQATTDADGQFALPLGSSALPTRFGLGQNYPNPFNPGTVIPYQLATAGYVRLEVFNLLGQRVAMLVEGELAAGSYTAQWDARDAAGYGVAAGVYVYRLTAGDATATRRMVLVDGPAGGPVSVAGPVRAVDVATDAAEYGVTVSGVGLATYVDAAFVVGVGSVDVVVERTDAMGRGKAAVAGILGDVDGDGRVDVADALVVAAYSVNATGLVPQGGDVDGDGEVNGEDARLLALYSVDPGHPGLPVGIGLPVGASVVGRVPSLVRGGAVLLSSVDGQVLAETTTDDAGDGFAFAVRSDGLPAWVLVTAVGGVGLDADGDGVVDRGPTAKPGRLRAWVGREYVAGGEALVVNPLTEMAYHALESRYGEDLSGLAGEEVAAALDSIAQDFLTVEGATYRDLLSFDAAADQGLLRVSWGVLQRQVVAAMNEGAGDAELARRVELVWQRPKAAGVTATGEVVEKVEFVGARQILTTARPDAWGSGVGVLHQAYIDDASGALVDVRLTKALGRRSSVRIGIFKEGNSLSVSGVSDLLDGVSFTEGGLRAFVPSIIDVVPDGAGQLRIILDKGLSARLSDQELVFQVNGREPTASQLAVIEDDPEVRWDFTNRIVLNTDALEFFNLEDATNQLIADNLLDRASENRLNWLTSWLSNCPDNGIRGIRFGHEDGFMISEMSVKMYDCVSGLNTEGFDVIVEGGKTLAEDVMWMFLSAKVAAVAATISPATLGGSLVIAGAAAVQAIAKFISAVGDIKYILTAGGATLVEKNSSSTRVNFLGEFTADGKMIQGAEYLPWLMVRNDKSEEEIIALRLRKGDEYIHFAELRVRHDRGYFVIPPNAMTLALDDPSDDSESVEFEMDTPGFFDRNVTLEIAARAYLPKFTVVKRFEESENVVFLDASSSLLPDNGRATYHWSYYTEQGSRVSFGSAPRLKVPVAAFAGVAEGQNFVMVQLDVVVGDATESVRRTVVLVGASSWNEGVVNDRDYVLVEVPDSPGDGGLPSGALASYRDFHVIAHDLDETQSHDGACKAELGSSVRLADWTDVVAYYDGGGSLPAFIAGLKLGVYGEALTGDQLAGGYRLSANGHSVWPERQAHGLDRHYFFARHDHDRPDYFLAHADLDNHHLSLGSWYGQGGYALCYGELSGGGGSSGQEQSFSLPGGGEMAFVWIEPGVFQMGSPDSEEGRWDDEGPVHEVEISRGFWLGKYEVTQGQWEAVMGSRPWSGRDYVRSHSSHPAVYISWHAVQEFIEKLNNAAGSNVYRLPSEAEWEYACRAGTQTRWSFGDDEGQLTHYAWYYANAWGVGERYAHAVGTKLPNAWGLYDMHGNVWEWVQDWYSSSYYNSSPRVDPPGPTSGSVRVIRGGSFDYDAQDVRSANRYYRSPDVRRADIGVRLVRIR